MFQSKFQILYVIVIIIMIIKYLDTLLKAGIHTSLGTSSRSSLSAQTVTIPKMTTSTATRIANIKNSIQSFIGWRTVTVEGQVSSIVKQCMYKLGT